MKNEKCDELSYSLDELSTRIKLSKQEKQASNATKRLEELKAAHQHFISAHPREADFMDWTATKVTIKNNKYGLSTSECMALGMSLIGTKPLGLKMAGVELSAEAIQNELRAASNSSINSFKTIFNMRTDEDSPELTCAEELVADFRKSVEVLLSTAGALSKVSPSDEVLSALKAAKNSCAKRALDSWQIKQLKDMARRHCAESDALMEDAESHTAIDSAIEAICAEYSCKASGEVSGGIPSLHSICYFAFGMALEFSDRAEMEDAPQWTLPRTVASTAASLIRHGLIESAVTYYKTRFFDISFDMNTTKATNDSKAWIQAGATSMDRFCRTDSNQFLDDFKKNALIYVKKS